MVELRTGVPMREHLLYLFTNNVKINPGTISLRVHKEGPHPFRKTSDFTETL